MPQGFQPGDFLVFQLEAGFAVIRVLAVEDTDGDRIWHLSAYQDLFPDVETAESSAADGTLTVSIKHVALTNRAFESTPVSKVSNTALTADEIAPFKAWVSSPARLVSDRSIRLLMGLR